MSDREKVMKGLECLTNVNLAIYKTECAERQCPYRNTDCEIAVMVDAYNILTQMTKYDAVPVEWLRKWPKDLREGAYIRDILRDWHQEQEAGE